MLSQRSDRQAYTPIHTNHKQRKQHKSIHTRAAQYKGSRMYCPSRSFATPASRSRYAAILTSKIKQCSPPPARLHVLWAVGTESTHHDAVLWEYLQAWSTVGVVIWFRARGSTTTTVSFPRQQTPCREQQCNGGGVSPSCTSTSRIQMLSFPSSFAVRHGRGEEQGMINIYPLVTITLPRSCLPLRRPLWLCVKDGLPRTREGAGGHPPWR